MTRAVLIQGDNTPTVDNKLDLILELGKVKSPLNESVTSDFIYAILNEKDKQLIIQMTHNASLTVGRLLLRAEAYCKWEWNNQQNKWEYKRLDKARRGILKDNINQIWKTMMTIPMMIAILNRNVKDNHMVQASLGQQTEKDQTTTIEGENELAILEKAKQLLKNEEKK